MAGTAEQPAGLCLLVVLWPAHRLSWPGVLLTWDDAAGLGGVEAVDALEEGGRVAEATGRQHVTANNTGNDVE